MPHFVVSSTRSGRAPKFRSRYRRPMSGCWAPELAKLPRTSCSMLPRTQRFWNTQRRHFELGRSLSGPSDRQAQMDHRPRERAPEQAYTTICGVWVGISTARPDRAKSPGGGTGRSDGWQSTYLLLPPRSAKQYGKAIQRGHCRHQIEQARHRCRGLMPDQPIQLDERSLSTAATRPGQRE